jgi:hypothetical protein
MSTRPESVSKRWAEPAALDGGRDGVALRDGGREGAEDHRSLGTLFKELSDDSTRLVRQEIELAKAEMTEKLDVYKANMAKLVIGGALMVAALFGLLITINHGLTALLDQFMDLGIAYWLSPLILTIVIGIIGKMMVGDAKENMSREGLAPRETIDSIKEEKQWIQGRTK